MLTMRTKQGGFSLIEMMIAVVVGIVVTGAAIVFVASSAQSTALTVQSSRLNQELRSVSELIARELRRARSISDPIVNVGTGCVGVACNNQALLQSLGLGLGTSAVCVTYGYQGGVGGDYRAIFRSEASGQGSIVLARGATARACDSGGTTINSDFVNITALTFFRPSARPSQVDITVSGRLRGDSSSTVQTYTTSIHIRSGSI